MLDLKDEDVYWCTADIGWVTGHSYIVYGPLANGATSVMFEGTPDYPDRDRFWDIVERRAVSVFYTAPTAIRGFMRWGTQYPGNARPLQPAVARDSRRADQSGGVDLVPRTYRSRKLPDRRHLVADGDRRDDDLADFRVSRRPSQGRQLLRCLESCRTSSMSRGNSVSDGQGGYLVMKRPWPSMFRTIWGDWDRYVATYFGKVRSVGLCHRRRRQARRGRLLLAAWPGRRRVERRGAPTRHDGDRERASESSLSGGGGRYRRES